MQHEGENEQIGEILDFWFGDNGADPDSARARNGIWFQPDPAFDRAVSDRFGNLVAKALDHGLEDFERSLRGQQALILLLDQFSRNIYRGEALAFAGDARSLGLCLGLVDEEAVNDLEYTERMFVFMPLQHAEDPVIQSLSVQVFTRLANQAKPAFRDLARANLKFARDHRDIIERFGRFPHRNQALGRLSSGRETEYLQGGARRFGQ